MAPKLSYTSEEVDDLPVLWAGDVIVAGGGSAGSTAAIAAARHEASVLLLESGGFLGGTGTRVLDTFYGFYAPGADRTRVVGGIGWEVCTQLFSEGMAFERPNTYGAGTGVTYEPEALKLLWDAMTSEAGVDVLFYALVTGVIHEADRITGLVVETRSGPARVTGRITIDATGDAEVSWRAGVTIDNSDGIDRLQPATATFRLGGVAAETDTTARIHEKMSSAVAEKRFRLPRTEGSIHVTTIEGVRHANMTRVSGHDLTDPWQLSEAEREGRRQVWEYAHFLKEDVEGYADSFLLGSSPRIGVRESRRVVGEYVLDRADFVGALSHPDDIGRCGAPIEDHGNGATTRWEYVGGKASPDGSTFGIPFGSLLPVTVDNLIVAGKCLSASHDAHASVRSIGQCMAMGQAAGTAAAMSVRESVAPRYLDRGRLRAALSADGALI